MIAAKDNPFAIGKIKAMGYIPQAMLWEDILRRLEQLNHTAGIVGPHGSGKTTLLRELEKRVRQSGIQTEKLFLNLDKRLSWQTIRDCIESIEPGGILFFDGACHLSFLRFRQLRHLTRKRNIGLVITAHREGLLDTLMVCRSTPALLEDIVNRLLDGKTIYSRAELVKMWTNHDGNIRDCLWQLYDKYAIYGCIAV